MAAIKRSVRQRTDLPAKNMNVSAGGKMCILLHRSVFAAEYLLPHKGDKTPPKSVFSVRLKVAAGMNL
jgi:hypothetical protein